jgi:hypothetical protein
MRKLLLTVAVALPASAIVAQTPAVRLINAPDASSPHTFGMVSAIRQLPGGKVLVNDGIKRQLTLLDASLGGATIVADSVSGTASSYGVRPGGLIAYFADSTLFVDPAGLSMFVIDPAGKIARVASVPRSQDAPALGSNLLGNPGLDGKGRLVYRGGFGRIVAGPRYRAEGPVAAAATRRHAPRRSPACSSSLIPRRSCAWTSRRASSTPRVLQDPEEQDERAAERSWDERDDGDQPAADGR